MKENLVLLTNSFPFKSDESFLYPELKVLSAEYKKIYILSKYNGNTISFDLPGNIRLIILENSSKSVSFHVKALFRFLFRILPIEMFQNFNLKGFFYPIKHNYFYFLESYFTAIQLERYFMKEGIEYSNCFFYSFWMNQNALSLIMLKFRHREVCTIARGHGFDVFPEQAKYGYNLYQASIVKYIDKLVIVSEKGTNYLKLKYPKGSSKIFCSYLGTEEHEQYSPSPIKTDKMFIILSCAHIRSIKQIHRIPQVLAELNIPCKWVHIGDGIDKGYMRNVELAVEEAKKQKGDLEIEFKGGMSQEEIFNYYSETPVGLFISLSNNEGVPVSMMEAISFGIPIFSTNVGGCNEICIDNLTGITFDKNLTNKDIAAKLLIFVNSIQLGNFDRMKIKQFWREKFCSNKNALELINKYFN